MYILFYLPSQSDFFLNQITLAPHGCKEFLYETGVFKQTHIDKIFKEVSIGCAPDSINNFANNIQGQSKSYVLNIILQ